jgi:hypothetical protein
MPDETLLPATPPAEPWGCYHQKDANVYAVQFTPENWPLLSPALADADLRYGPDGSFDGVAVYGPKGREWASFGDWIVRFVAGTCRALSDSEFTAAFEPTRVPADSGEFKTIAFMGHNEHTGLVTEFLKNGQPAYRVELPDKLWGGNPLAYVEYSASAWFSEHPVTEESVRTAWESRRKAAADRALREARWRQEQLEQERALALESGTGSDGLDDGY